MHLSGRILLVALLAASGLAIGCGGSEDSAQRTRELETLFASGQFDELASRIQVARDGGASGTSLDLYEGLSHLRRNQDRHAEKLLARAAAADSSLIPRIAQEYRAAAWSDHEAGWGDRAARRMRDAYKLDGVVDMGELGSPVSTLLYNDKDYAAALPLYGYLLEHGDWTEKKIQEFTFRRGACLEKVGLPDAAVEQYREYWKTWPWASPTAWSSYVMWRYQNVLLRMGDDALGVSEPRRAIELYEEARKSGWNPELVQRARLGIGRAHERLEEPREALIWYERVLNNAAGDGGGVVESARARIDELRATGAH